MHMVSEKDSSSDEVDTLRKSRNPRVVLTANGEVHTHEAAQVFVHDHHLFVTVQLLEETPPVLSFGKLCEDHGYSNEWVSGQKPRLTKEEKTIIFKTDTFVPLVVPGLSTSSGSDSSSTSPPQDSSSSSSSPASERSDEVTPRKWCRSTPKTQNKKKRMSVEMRTTVSEIFLSGWRSSQIIQKTQNCLHPHTVLRTQIRNILRKCYQNRESTVFILTFDVCLRTKMTRAPCRRHTGEALPRAEKFGDLITADQKVINEGCESRDNHRYAVVVRNIATQWIKSYPSKTQRLHTRRERVYESSSSRHTHQKSLTPTFHWNLEPPHRSETNGFSERAVRRVKEGSPAVLLQSGLDERWWSDSMECCRYLRSVKDLLADGKTPYERRFGESFRGPVIPFGQWLNVIRFLHETSPGTTNLVRRCYQNCSSDMHQSRGEFGKEIFWSQTLRNWKT